MHIVPAWIRHTVLRDQHRATVLLRHFIPIIHLIPIPITGRTIILLTIMDQALFLDLASTDVRHSRTSAGRTV